MTAEVLDSYRGSRLIPPRVRSFLSQLAERAFTLSLTQPKMKTIRVLRDGEKVGYINDSVLKHDGLIGYHFIDANYSSDSCPPERVPYLLDELCARYACSPTAFYLHRDDSAKGKNSGRTFLLLLDPAIAMRILQNDGTLALDEESVLPLIGGKYVEGKLVEVVLRRRERDPSARSACLSAYGFDCYICGVNLKQRYAGLPTEVVHVHHEEPLAAAIGERQLDPVATMKPLCPNCHCVVHSRIPPYTIEEVRRMLRGEI